MPNRLHILGVDVNAAADAMFGGVKSEILTASFDKILRIPHTDSLASIALLNDADGTGLLLGTLR